MKRVHAALFGAATLFSLNYIVSKVAMRSFAPLTFAYLRILGSALLLHVSAPRDRTPIDRADFWRLAGFSLLAVAFNQTLFLTGLALTSAHVAAILITAMPVFTLAIALVLRREQGTPRKIAGIVLAAVGALMIVGGERIEGTRDSMLGALCIVLNSLSYALYLVLSKPMMARLSARRVVTRMFDVAAMAMIPIAIVPLIHQKWSVIPGSAWLGLVVVIAGPTVGAYLINAWALDRADSSLVAAYIYVQPVLATLMAAAFLGERMRAGVAVAAMLIFAGVYFAGSKKDVE
ncbi:MAG: DMT family transporter [Thermoanaerobaculia bacterium]